MIGGCNDAATLSPGRLPGGRRSLFLSLPPGRSERRWAMRGGDWSNYVPARLTDPETSQASAERYSAPLRMVRVKTAKHRMLYAFSLQALTAVEAALMSACFAGREGNIMSVETHRKRAAELHAAGYIEDTGLRRKNLGSPDESIVWQITPAGRAALPTMGEPT